ncbi:unnamed protein product [Amoebophrya sp. A25]|nr:unnamed protein product [Amoebophrya sp. A25]|eukprot:GSA25T00014780001.1
MTVGSFAVVTKKHMFENRGITRTPTTVFDPRYKGVSLKLHAYAARMWKDSKLYGETLFVIPVKSMFNILASAFPRHGWADGQISTAAKCSSDGRSDAGDVCTVRIAYAEFAGNPELNPDTIFRPLPREDGCWNLGREEHDLGQAQGRQVTADIDKSGPAKWM